MRVCAKLSLGDGSTKTPNQRWPSGSSNCSSRWRWPNSRPTAPCLFKDVSMATRIGFGEIITGHNRERPWERQIALEKVSADVAITELWHSMCTNSATAEFIDASDILLSRRQTSA